MGQDPDRDRDLHHRLGVDVAEAQLQVRACQEQLKRATDRLAEARTAMAAARDRLAEAQRLQDRIAANPWTRPDPSADP